MTTATSAATLSKNLSEAIEFHQAIIAEGVGSFSVSRGRVSTDDGRTLPPSLLTGHIAKLVAKSQAQGGTRVDQTLLLRSLATQLRGREKLGWFVAETLLRLALLGTAIAAGRPPDSRQPAQHLEELRRRAQPRRQDQSHLSAPP